MIDSYPSDPANADYEIQLKIDGDLRNAQRLRDEFEKHFPEDSSAKIRTLVERTLQRPRGEAQYPALTAAKSEAAWLMPLVHRLQWNQGRGEAAAKWTGLLAEMTCIILTTHREIGEAEFLAITEVGAALLSHRRFGFWAKMAGFACKLEKKAPLSPAAVDALRRLLRLHDPTRGSLDEHAGVLWPLFRSVTGFAATDETWSARVRRDIASMPPKSQTDWMKVFDPEMRAYEAAVKRLGKGEVEPCLRRWIGMVREGTEPFLISNDAIVFRHLIRLCKLMDGYDDLLYEIARTPWTHPPDHCWFYTFVEVLKTRPPNRAFACFEALAMNPATARHDVRQQYDGLLAVFGAQTAAESPVGVDGFALDSDPQLTAQHRRIDQLLRMAAAAAEKGRYADPVVTTQLAHLRSMQEQEVDLPPAKRAALKAWEAQMTRPLPWFPVAPEVTAARNAMVAAILEEFSADPASLNRALNARSEWIRTHTHEYSKDALQLWNEWLHGLGCGEGIVGKSLIKVDDLTLEGLLSAIQTGGNSTKIFELCQKYVEKHGWHADLVEPFRQFIPSLGVACNHTENARAEWFLWFENVAPIKVEDCWSYRIKVDLRAMPAEKAAAWRALLDNPAFQVTGTPPAKWMKVAAKAFPKVGVAAFRRCFAKWFEPFEKQEPVRLTITGRNILRVLIWYALIAKDEGVDQALLEFAKAKWKTKQFSQRAAQAEMAFSYVVGQRQPKGAVEVLEALVKSGQAFADSKTHEVYEELCARQNRQTVPAIPLRVKPAKERPSNQLLDNMTIGEFREMLQGKLPPPK